MSRVIGSLLPGGTPMNRYKEHPIYGVAVPAPEHQWYSRGLVFYRDLNQTGEIKRIESTAECFKTKKKARENGVELCKTRICEQALNLPFHINDTTFSLICCPLIWGT